MYKLFLSALPPALIFDQEQAATDVSQGLFTRVYTYMKSLSDTRYTVPEFNCVPLTLSFKDTLAKCHTYRSLKFEKKKILLKIVMKYKSITKYYSINTIDTQRCADTVLPCDCSVHN